MTTSSLHPGFVKGMLRAQKLNENWNFYKNIPHGFPWQSMNQTRKEPEKYEYVVFISIQITKFLEHFLRT